jgi:hypothetical protein
MKSQFLTHCTTHLQQRNLTRSTILRSDALKDAWQLYRRKYLRDDDKILKWLESSSWTTRGAQGEMLSANGMTDEFISPV